MSDAAPERIWVDDERPLGGSVHVYTEGTEGARKYCVEYLRTDLHTAALAERDARIAALEAGLWECADDLEACVNAEYPISMRDAGEAFERAWRRDMEPVVRARALLDRGKKG